LSKGTLGGDLAPIWTPQPGDSISGEVVRRDEIDTKHGLTGMLEVEDAKQGLVAIFCGSTVLKRLYSRVDVGFTIDVTFEGEKLSKNGNRFKSYVGGWDSNGTDAL
jgi:hypothetical protein